MEAKKNTLDERTCFHHIAVKCHDFDKSVKFYQALGCQPSLQWGEGDERACMMDVGGGAYIELFAGGEETREAPESSVIHFCMHVPECDVYYAKAMEAGAVSKDEPMDLVINGKERDQPIRIAFVYGPDREVLEFFQYRTA